MNIQHKIVSTALVLIVAFGAYGQIAPDMKSVSKVPGFDVQMVVGLGRDSSFELPYPIAVRVKNNSGTDFDGNLIISFYSQEHIPAVRIPVDLPNNSHKVYRLCLPIEEHTSMRLKFVDSGKEFWTGSADPLSRDQSDTTNFNLLVIDGKERSLTVLRPGGGTKPLDQWNTIYDRATLNPNCFAVSAWSLPEHDAPLYSFDGILFSNESQGEGLTTAQLEALAKYLVGGGSIVVPQQRSKLKDRILSNAPLNVEWSPISVDKTLQKQSIGKGMLITYDGTFYPLTDTSGNVMSNALQTSIVELISYMPQTNFPGSIASNYNLHRNDISTRGATSILVVIGMFLLYTIVIGPSTFIFRKNKRRMAIFLGLSISSFVGLSIICGIFLRNRKGDLDWITVTELTPDGSIQTAGITVRSCAGQRHDLQFLPQQTEMRMFKVDSRYAYRRYSYQFDNYENQRANATFAILPTDPKETSELDVPLAPWGRGHVLARNYVPELKSLNLNFEVINDTAGKSRIGSRTVNGKPVKNPLPLGNLGVVVHGSLTNTLEIPVSDLEIIFQVYSGHVNQYGYNANAPYINTVAFVPKGIGRLKPGESRKFKHRLIHTQQFNYYNRANRIRYDYQKDKGSAALLLPKLNHRQRMHVVIVGRVEDSFLLKAGDSDFVNGKGTHFIIQNIPVDEMPDMSKFIVDASKIPPKKTTKGQGW